MLQIKTARRYQSLTLLKQVLAIGAWIVLTVFIDQIFRTTQYRMIIQAAGTIGVFGLVLYFLRNGSKFRWNQFHCPDCENLIAEPLQNSDVGGEPILYMCAKCEVLWYSGNTARD